MLARDTFLIIDESQNCTIHELKTVITRIGENSKIVLLGDTDQIDTPYIDTFSNGLTIIREYISDKDTHRPIDIEWISHLLEPTIIYVEHIEKIRKAGVKLKALAHITGGGFKNVDRVLLENFRVRYEREDVFYSYYQLFQWIQTKTGMSMKEMRETFNCGIGMVMILSPEDVERLPVDYIHLGEIISNEN